MAPWEKANKKAVLPAWKIFKSLLETAEIAETAITSKDMTMDKSNRLINDI